MSAEPHLHSIYPDPRVFVVHYSKSDISKATLAWILQLAQSYECQNSLFHEHTYTARAMRFAHAHNKKQNRPTFQLV